MSAARFEREKGVAGLCRRLLALVLAVALLVGGWQPGMAAAHDGLSFGTLGSAATIDVDRGDPDAPEKASGQHCAHCACHAVARVEIVGVLPAPEARPYKAGLIVTAVSGRTIPPPARPPRT